MRLDDSRVILRSPVHVASRAPRVGTFVDLKAFFLKQRFSQALHCSSDGVNSLTIDKEKQPSTPEVGTSILSPSAPKKKRKIVFEEA